MKSYICSKTSSPIILALSIIICRDNFFPFSTYYYLIWLISLFYLPLSLYYKLCKGNNLVGKYELNDWMKLGNDFPKFIIVSICFKNAVIKICIMNKIILLLNSKMYAEPVPKEIVALFHMACSYQEVFNPTNTHWDGYITGTTWCSLIFLKIYRINLDGDIFIIILCYKLCPQSL